MGEGGSHGTPPSSTGHREVDKYKSSWNSQEKLILVQEVSLHRDGSALLQ